MKIYRQGDLLFKEVKAIPAGDRKKRRAGHILEGEATGRPRRLCPR
jgi:hypothetical protein